MDLSRRGIASTSFALGLVLSQQATASVAVPAGLAASIAGSALANVASVAVASTGVLSLLTLANFKVSTVVLAGICVVATAGTAALSHTVSEQEGAIPVFAAHVAKGPSPTELLGRVAASEKTLNETLQKLREVDGKLAALPPPRRQAAASANMIRAGKVALQLAKDPECVRLARQSMRAYVAGRYATVFAELKLPPEKFEALKEILVSSETESRLARSRANAAGERNATEEERAALRVSTEEALRSLLGEDGLAMMRAAEKRGSMNKGRVDRGIAADLLDGGGPLTGDQGKQLAGLLEEKILDPARATGSTEASASAPFLPSGLTVGETAVIAGMTSAFTQPQRELLAEHFRFEHERHAVEQRIATIQR